MVVEQMGDRPPERMIEGDAFPNVAKGGSERFAREPLHPPAGATGATGAAGKAGTLVAVANELSVNGASAATVTF